MTMPPRPLPMKQTPSARPRFSTNQLLIIAVKGTKVRKETLSPTSTEQR